MEFDRPSKKRRYRVEGSSEYPTRLQLYKNPPVQTIELQEFEELALQRLKCKFVNYVVQAPSRAY